PWDGPRSGGLGTGELDGAGGPQAGGGILPGQRLTRYASGADLAAIRRALRQALHSGHHARTAGRTGPGGGQRQPDGTDLLAVATRLEPIRGVPAGLERR